MRIHLYVHIHVCDFVWHLHWTETPWKVFKESDVGKANTAVFHRHWRLVVDMKCSSRGLDC